MLVLTRKPKEEIHIGNGVTITVLRVKGQSVRIGIDAPNDIRIVRGELNLTSDQESPSATASDEETAEEPRRVQRQAPVDALVSRQDQTTVGSSGSGFIEEPTVAPRSSSSPATCGQRLPQQGRGNTTLRMLAARQREAALGAAGPVSSGPMSVK